MVLAKFIYFQVKMGKEEALDLGLDSSDYDIFKQAHKQSMLN
eukprot:CAMPEP_0170554416 /NCGR_PEP_ID=MMETSP0211-20121228/12246_1 /TAXON_ID=311385 /ORGANISM="Pseudokeronopsis sp., Strain OXSARD2" /LENGTH=41 /DNA_ID= /DNA_START= /DNA_END= /DNA_ORIENTATION=